MGLNIFLDASLFRVALTSVYNDLTGLRWLRKYFDGRGRRTYLGLDSWAEGKECRTQSLPEKVVPSWAPRISG